MYEVYKIENKVNGKVYVGLTSAGIKRRMDRHWSSRKNERHRKHNSLYIDMLNQERDDFHISTLMSGFASRKDAEVVESFWTGIYKASGLSYNRMIGDTPTEAALLAAVEANRNGIGGLQAERERRSAEWVRSGNPNATRVRCVETGDAFDCIKDAGEAYGINPQNISTAIHGGHKSGGFTWVKVVEGEDC